MLTEAISFFIQCSFRHCLVARQTDVVCEKWIQKKCTDISCCKRHPKLIKQQSGMKKKTKRCTRYNLHFFTLSVKVEVCYVTQYLSHNRTVGHVFPYKLSLMRLYTKEKQIFNSLLKPMVHSLH